MIHVKRLAGLAFASTVLAATVFAAVVSSAGPASAQQISNKPINIGRGMSATSSGMPLGYRQGILEEELNNSRPDALVRDATGALVTVERKRGGQAFLRQQVSPFVPGNAASTAGGGLSFSVGGFGAKYASGVVISQGGGGATVIISSQTTPIESWINQLYMDRDNAS